MINIGLKNLPSIAKVIIASIHKLKKSWGEGREATKQNVLESLSNPEILN